MTVNADTTQHPLQPDERPPSPVPLDGPETRGIEVIDDSERGGKPGALFWVWATPNVSFLSITMGALMVAGLGMSLLEALATTVIGALGWILVGIIAVSGPAAGTSGSVISRAMYGLRGNKIIVGLYGWLLAAVYLSLTWSSASLSGLGLLGRLGGTTSSTVGVILVIVIAAVTAILAVYGHGLITRTYPYIVNIVSVVFLIAAVFMVPYMDLSYRPAEPLSGASLATSMTIGATILISTPLSFINSPDMARYLPRTTAPWKTASATALGGALPGIVVTMIGALIATAADFDMVGDPMGAFNTALPGWFFVIFTLSVIIAGMALNGMTIYSASLSLQALGIPIRRIPSALIITVIGTVLTIVSVAIYDFTSSVSLLLQLVVVAAGPLIAVYATDVILRRNRYDGHALSDETSSSLYWYRNGFNWAGLISLVIGGALSVLCVNTDILIGPVAAATGLDLSIPVGIIVSIVCYTVLYPRSTGKEIQ